MLSKIEKGIKRDRYGYLLNPADWNEVLAQHIAIEESIKMSTAHWEVIRFLRAFYTEFNISPTVRMMVKAIMQKFGEEYGNSRYLFYLFPGGPAKQATKIAGLPKPVRCL